MAMSQIPTLRTHIWQVRSWTYLPNPPQWQFHRFLLWELIFGRPGLRQIFHTPTKWQWFHRFLIWGLIFGRPGLGRSSITPPNSAFTDSYSESSYLAGQVLADLPPIPHRDFTDSYSKSSYLRDQVLGDLLSQMAMSQIHNLRAHICRRGLGRSTLTNGNVTDS